MSKKAFSVTGKPFRDSDATVTFHVYPCAPTAQRLPTPSPIHPIWPQPTYWTKESPGLDLFEEPKLEKPNRIPVKPKGDHWHGNLEDFFLGGVYDPDSPPLERDVTGLPADCAAGGGGFAFGGFGLFTPPIRLAFLGGTPTLVAPSFTNRVDVNAPGPAWATFGSTWLYFLNMRFTYIVAGTTYRVLFESTRENRAVQYAWLDGFGGVICAIVDLGTPVGYAADLTAPTGAVSFQFFTQITPGDPDPTTPFGGAVLPE